MSDYPPPPPPPSGPQPWGQPQQPPWGAQPPPQQQWGPPGQQQWSPPGQAWPSPQMQPGWGRYGGFWARFAAYIIDVLILSPFWIVARIELATGSKTVKTCTFDANALCKVPSGGTRALYWLIVLIGIGAAVVYFALTEGRTGQTVGKKALGLKVVDTYTGAPIGSGRAVGRYFAKILSGLPCALGYLWMLWDPNKQTWHDKIVRSYVVAA